MSSSPPPDSPSSAPPSDSEPPPSSSPPPSPPSSSPPPSSPPPTSSSPPPTTTSPPPPTPTTSPPPQNSDSSPPPSTPNNTSPPPPSENNNKSPPSHSNYFSPPPPLRSSSSPPSPPPPKALSPPSSDDPTHKADASGYNFNVTREQLTYGGIAAGAGLLLIMLVALLCACTKKKKKKPMQYYGDPSRKGGEYYHNGSQYTNYHNGHQPGDHIVKIPPPPGGAGHGGWAPSPPPPPMMSSSEEYSSSYSGSQVMPPPHPSLGFNKSTFTFEELSAATGGFAQSNLLGQGGFGYVHKGVLPNGKEVAVKSLKAGSGQGEREFQAEVEIISRVHHRHLVSLVGYCISGGQRMLVYEFLPNKTLEYHLHGKGRPTMDWSARVKIAMGSAKGLAYLHEDCHPRIIHRDIKTANILLDYNMEAQVADFGLAKLSSDTYTHVSTRIMGTFGYLAPEYAASGKLTEKSDVFSYGVMLLELITGKRPVDTTNAHMADSLVDWARPIMARAIEDGNFLGLVDPYLEENYNVQELTRMVACAAASIRHSARRRPKMSQIVRALEGDASLEDLNEVAKSSQSSAFSSNTSAEYQANSSYNTDMKKFKKMALQSGEYESSEFGATSEYGLNPSSSSSESSQEFDTKPYGGSRRQFT